MPSSSQALFVGVLEDEAMLRDRILLPGLRRFGFDVIGYETVAELQAYLEDRPIDLLVLDIGLPDGNGFSVARALRDINPALGIVMLTSRAETSDRVKGLAEGADSYLTKPVEMDLLAATLHSLARRIETGRLVFNTMRKWHLEVDGWCLVSPMGESVALTKSERKICKRLFAEPGELISREALIEALTDNSHDFDAHRLDSMIHRLRSKVQSRCGVQFPLSSIHGRGYFFKLD